MYVDGKIKAKTRDKNQMLEQQYPCITRNSKKDIVDPSLTQAQTDCEIVKKAELAGEGSTYDNA
ncbi:MAG: hypothetical protein RCG15_01825 [Candidatus Rickettsia vulgarisii]